jgi:hypothetical protein
MAGVTCKQPQGDFEPDKEKVWRHDGHLLIKIWTESAQWVIEIEIANLLKEQIHLINMQKIIYKTLETFWSTIRRWSLLWRVIYDGKLQTNKSL